MRPLETDFTAGTSEPSPCQMPLYAVVDKTRKKTNTRPKVADDMKEARRNDPQGDDDHQNAIPLISLENIHLHDKVLVVTIRKIARLLVCKN